MLLRFTCTTHKADLSDTPDLVWDENVTHPTDLPGLVDEPLMYGFVGSRIDLSNMYCPRLEEGNEHLCEFQIHVFDNDGNWLACGV